jgi:hypothetical protein
METEEYKKFIAALDEAIQLGLKIDKKGEHLDIQRGHPRNLSELYVYAYAYRVTTYNGYGQGHTLFQVYTKNQANKIASIIDVYIFDDNDKRSVKVENELMAYNTYHLNKYIYFSRAELQAKEHNDL